MVLEEHIIEEQKHLGYICFTKFFKSYTEQGEEFSLIEGIDNNTLMRQFQALMNSYQVRQCLFTIFVLSCWLTQPCFYAIASAGLC